MKSPKKICVIFSFLLLILSGCGKNHSQNTIYRAVTEIDVVSQHREGLVHRHYTTPEKIRPVLLYIRLANPYGKALELPEDMEDIFLIAVTLSDGQKRYYRQAEHRYFSVGNTAWRQIKPETAFKLYEILEKFPSDI